MSALDEALEETKHAIRENLAKLVSGKSTLNADIVDDCTHKLVRLYNVISDAKRTADKNIGLLKVSGEPLEQVETHWFVDKQDLISEVIDLMRDEVVLSPDIYRREDTVKFVLAQAARPSALEALAGIIEERLRIISDPSSPSITRTLGDDFSDMLRGFLVGEIDPVIEEFRNLSRENDQINVVFGPMVRSRTLERQARRVDEIETLAERNLENIQAAAHAVGAERLSKDFDARAKKDSLSATLWTAAVFACIVLGVGLPILVLSVDTVVLTKLSGTPGMIIKALTGIPFFGAAGYCARIASQHRETARHLGILTTQIDSAPAYVAELPDDNRLQLMMMLGRRAFSDPELMVKDKGSVGATPEELIPLLEKAMDVAKDVVKRRIAE